MFRPAFTAGEAWSAPLPEASPALSGGAVEGAGQGPAPPPEASPALSGGAVEGAGQGSAPLLETSPAPWGFPPACTADRDRIPVLR